MAHFEWLHLPSLLPFLSATSTPWVVLSQGSPRFIQALPLQVLACHHTILCFHQLPTTPPPASWYTITIPFSHTGCLLTGSWTFWSSVALHTPVAQSIPILSGRSLRHIISSTMGGSLVPAPPPVNDHLIFTGPHWGDEQRHYLNWNGCLPQADPLTPVRCPSVFTSTKWTIRRLSPKELCDVFIIPSNWVGMFSKFHPWETHRLPFLQTPPGAILEHVFENYVCATSAQGNPNSLFGPSPTHHSQYIASPQYIDPTQFSAIDSNLALAQANTSIDFTKAVKADNAEVPIFLWDDRIWNLNLHGKKLLDEFRKEHQNRCPLEILRMLFL
jgi:hypothetical protein